MTARTALKIFSTSNALAVQAIVAADQRITDEAVLQWSPVIDPQVSESVTPHAQEPVRPFPVVLRARPDELLSSWLTRHAAVALRYPPKVA